MNSQINDHLSPEVLTALTNGELAGDDLAHVSRHLAACCACTARALEESLLQRSTVRAGQRYAMPDGFEARMRETIAAQRNQLSPTHAEEPAAAPLRIRTFAWTGAFAVLLLVTASGFVAHDFALRNTHASAVIAETVDEHIAAMAAAAPEVVSTDRHTVKPWFQGKLPFSFNLPASLPPDFTLDGANLVQLDGVPTAQLLFSIGKHHASVFLRERDAAQSSGEASAIYHAERNGFHVDGFRTAAIDGLAVSDVDPARLHDLALALEQAQATE